MYRVVMKLSSQSPLSLAAACTADDLLGQPETNARNIWQAWRANILLPLIVHGLAALGLLEAVELHAPVRAVGADLLRERAGQLGQRWEVVEREGGDVGLDPRVGMADH
jgi:hypothetical protein